MTSVLEEIHSTKVTVTSEGHAVAVNSGVSQREGEFLASLVKKCAARKTLEIGCAMGISSLHICEALRTTAGAVHYVVDPFQMTDWRGIGLKSLERAGLRDLVHFIPERSELAMPVMMKEHEGTFDLVFIDGWHTFDQTLLESYYALRLLKKSGVLVIDDCDMAGIAKTVRYLKNYPSVQEIGHVIDYPSQPVLNLLCRIFRWVPISIDVRHLLPVTIQSLVRRPNMIALQKTDEDRRSWNWYKSF